MTRSQWKNASALSLAGLVGAIVDNTAGFGSVALGIVGFIVIVIITERFNA